MVACENIPKETQTVSRYFDVDSLISVAIQNSMEAKDSLQVNKLVEIDHKTEQKTLFLDRQGLEDEMRLFRIMDINSPTTAFAYESEEEAGKVIYHLKENEEQTGIVRLSVTKNAGGQIVEGLFNENNQIYYTSRQLKLEIENGTIRSYEMTGKQKMFFKDTIYYSMKGIITN